MHQCPTCSQTCKPFTPKKTIDPTKRDRGTRCSGCNTRGINHTGSCPIHAASTARLLAMQPDDFVVTQSMLARMSVIPFDNKRQVGCVLYADEAEAQAVRDRLPEYEAAQDARRLAHDAWTAQWRSVAEAAWAAGAMAGEPVALIPDSELEAVA